VTEPLRVEKHLVAPHGVARVLVQRAAPLSLPFAERCKSRLRTTLCDGRELAVILPRGTVLRDGDLLVAQSGALIRVVASAQMLLEVRSSDPLLLTRAAYHLGNRHIRVQFGQGYLRLEDDPVLCAMLEGLGLAVCRAELPFEPESGAYGGGHRHGHEESFQEDYALAQTLYAQHEHSAHLAYRPTQTHPDRPTDKARHDPAHDHSHSHGHGHGHDLSLAASHSADEAQPVHTSESVPGLVLKADDD
jgi:urease accessory protein